jgi:ferredoxin
VLFGVVVGGSLSIRWLGLLDPLVIFNRVVASMLINGLSLQQPPQRIFFSLVSLVFVLAVVLELSRARFWCRNLCPLGALFSLVARFSLMKRRVSNACTGCGECRVACAMNAIPKDASDTDYSDCTFCLECQSDCPKGGITFGFSPQKTIGLRDPRVALPQAVEMPRGEPREAAGTRAGPAQSGLSRREVLAQTVAMTTAGALGLVATPLTAMTHSRPILRPPGALPEDEFVRTCVLCQECVRICPTGGLRPALFEGGLASIGTPQLVPRQGGCSLNPSCPNLCAQVCPVGAILPTRPEELKIGLAHVHRDLCIAWDQGGKCLVCVEACLNHAAIPFHGRVTVDAQNCTGCGRCESGCPVPGSAIRVYPIT